MAEQDQDQQPEKEQPPAQQSSNINSNVLSPMHPETGETSPHNETVNMGAGNPTRAGSGSKAYQRDTVGSASPMGANEEIMSRRDQVDGQPLSSNQSESVTGGKVDAEKPSRDSSRDKNIEGQTQGNVDSIDK